MLGDNGVAEEEKVVPWPGPEIGFPSFFVDFLHRRLVKDGEPMIGDAGLGNDNHGVLAGDATAMMTLSDVDGYGRDGVEGGGTVVGRRGALVGRRGGI